MKKLIAILITTSSLAAWSQSASAQQRCSNIFHVGDSLTLHSMEFQRREYARLGYKNAVVIGHGSMSVFTKGTGSSLTGLGHVINLKKRADKNTCWVIALGTNDSGFYRDTRLRSHIKAVMNEIPKRRVLWVTVWKGTRTNGPSARLWNKFLVAERRHRPMMEILQWDDVVAKHRELLNPDGVHYGRTGAQLRAKLIAKKISSLWL